MSSIAQNDELNELCPSCGEWVAQLNDETGWCDPCSGITPSTHCRRCNNPLGANNGLCNRCKYVVWLETNADAIDRTMAAHGCNAATAKRLVLAQNRKAVVCLSCGSPIKGGTRGRSIFCTKTVKCRKAQNAYRYYRDIKNLTHEEALEKALFKSTLFTLLDRITNK